MSLASRITKCCAKPVMRISKREYPTDHTFYINLSADCCTGCREEWPELTYSCDMCGDPTDTPTTTKLGEFCLNCLHEYASDLMEKA